MIIYYFYNPNETVASDQITEGYGLSGLDQFELDIGSLWVMRLNGYCTRKAYGFDDEFGAGEGMEDYYC